MFVAHKGNDEKPGQGRDAPSGISGQLSAWGPWWAFLRMTCNDPQFLLNPTHVAPGLCCVTYHL